MLFADIDILDENLEHRAHQWVGVDAGRIAYLGGEAPQGAAAEAFGEVYDGRGKLLMPALYNAHTHAPMTLLRGYAENLPLQAWLNDRVWPFEAKMTPEDNYWATKLNLAEMARFGVTETDLARQDGGAAFTGLMRFQADRALALYDKAFSLLPDEDRPAQKPGIMMASIYRELLLEIVRCGFPVLTRRVSLTKGKKLWLAWKAWLHE